MVVRAGVVGFCCVVSAAFVTNAQDSVSPGADAVDAGEHIETPSPPCTVEWPDGIGRDAFILETWPDGVVPYEFDANVNTDNRTRAVRAMQKIMDVSGVYFIPRTNEEDRIVFIDASGNSSALGRVGGPQFIRISSWSRHFVIVHELMHALGDNHEHQRPDRDEYVRINWENIRPGADSQFEIRPFAQPESPYDFLSVMHYSGGAFTQGQGLTIEALPPYEPYQQAMGQRDRLSEGDILGLNARYGPPVVSDLTDDYAVNSVDLAILLDAWGGSTVDFDGDGVCGYRDLATLLSEWR